MKKYLVTFTLLALAGLASAQQVQGTTSTSGSASFSNGGVQGQQQGIDNTKALSGNLSSNCIGSCVDQTEAAVATANGQVATANIQAQAARDVAGTTVTIKNVPSVSGPALTTSNDTCMGSTSGSVNIAGLGIGGGTSWVDNNCKMLKNSREMWNMGMKGAALALMCTDAANKEALELTGFECPQTTKAKADASKSATADKPQYTDPIIRARLGLEPLVAAK